MTQEEIVAAVYAAFAKEPCNSDQPSQDERIRRDRVFDDECERLCERLRLEEGHDLFGSLFTLACAEYDPLHTPTNLAANLLLYLMPPCPLSCHEAVRALSLSRLNLSEKEVIWYLAEYFGTSTVLAAVEALNGENYIIEARAKQKAWFEEWYAAHPIQTVRDTLMSPPVPWDSSMALDSVQYWVGVYADRQKAGKKWTPQWLWRKGA